MQQGKLLLHVRIRLEEYGLDKRRVKPFKFPRTEPSKSFPGSRSSKDRQASAVLAVNFAPDHGPVIDVNSGSIVGSDLGPANLIAIFIPILVVFGHEF
ncbi:hypothetical protein EVAR_45808_1 [Eumeta japonica]|uniref:Uncharacterized protein n=1 Tax=Eumeta variegata TaxID=151549 RepID=A0A4C1X1L4_EUMVA|nr:hypothetical protein EVAR_45808_1 [Eumeta japonica]